VRRKQLYIRLWFWDVRTTKGSFVPSDFVFFRKVLPGSDGAAFRGSARASGAVAVDHYAIKAWRAVVRKDEQFIPELFGLSRSSALMRGCRLFSARR
jgi:hypothetical protein